METTPASLGRAYPYDDIEALVETTHVIKNEHKNWASFLAFLLVFLVWDTWDSLMSYVKQESGSGFAVHALCNVLLVGFTVPIIRQKGPEAFRNKRAIAVASVLSAVGSWDIMDLTVRSLIQPGHSANLLFYSTALFIVVIIVLSYERRNNYDIIGGHLISTS